MKTRDAPSRSKGHDKAEESARKAETPLARFSRLAAKVMDVPPEAVRNAERKTKRRRHPEGKG